MFWNLWYMYYGYPSSKVWRKMLATINLRTSVSKSCTFFRNLLGKLPLLEWLFQQPNISVAISHVLRIVLRAKKVVKWNVNILNVKRCVVMLATFARYDKRNFSAYFHVVGKVCFIFTSRCILNRTFIYRNVVAGDVSTWVAQNYVEKCVTVVLAKSLVTKNYVAVIRVSDFVAKFALHCVVSVIWTN